MMMKWALATVICSPHRNHHFAFSKVKLLMYSIEMNSVVSEVRRMIAWSGGHANAKRPTYRKTINLFLSVCFLSRAFDICCESCFESISNNPAGNLFKRVRINYLFTIFLVLKWKKAINAVCVPIYKCDSSSQLTYQFGHNFTLFIWQQEKRSPPPSTFIWTAHTEDSGLTDCEWVSVCNVYAQLVEFYEAFAPNHCA